MVEKIGANLYQSRLRPVKQRLCRLGYFPCTRQTLAAHTGVRRNVRDASQRSWRLDVRPAVYACGSGKATLRNFRYWPKVNVPTVGTALSTRKGPAHSGS
jgi:hypothetical protein